LGRVEPAKGVYELLEAFAQIHAEHPETTLTLAGDGPSLDALRAVARERGLEAATHFRGHVAHETLGELFAEIDCLVLPSYSEALPLSVLEAATYHRVIVATDVGDLRALFGDRIRTVAPRDATALAGALRAAVTDAAPTADYGAVIARVAIGSVVDEILQSLLAPEATTARAAAAT
jgi:glycosyltransferase involved in cell wall biosynthesis